MNQELVRIIELYQSSIAELFPRLAKSLDLQLPISNKEWACKGLEQRGKTACGIRYFIHGYGVALEHQGIKVDFDLGGEGQIDGIDPWKLWCFLEESNIRTSFRTTKEVSAAIKEEVSNGNMVYSGYMLYYLAR